MDKAEAYDAAERFYQRGIEHMHEAAHQGMQAEERQVNIATAYFSAGILALLLAETQEPGA